MDEEETAPKRHKTSHPSFIFGTLQQAYNTLNSITAHSLPFLQQLAGVSSSPNLKRVEGEDPTGEVLVNCIASGILQLSIELQIIKQNLAIKAQSSCKPDAQLFQTVLHSTLPRWRNLLSPMPLTFLAATSASMFKLLVNDLSFKCPPKSSKFQHFQPTSLVDVSLDPIDSFSNVTKLHFKDDIEDITEINIPSQITQITFGSNYNGLVPNLPSSVTHISFGEGFVRSVANLPSSLTNLSFGERFNRPVSALPPKLKVLKLGPTFNQPIDNLPPTLRELHLGKQFNKEIRSLPVSLTCLMITAKYLPSNIITFPLSQLYNLTTLVISGGLKSLDNLPTITDLKIITSTYHFLPTITKLPSSLLRFHILGSWESPLDFLPPSLTHFVLECGLFTNPLDKLPSSLTHLRVAGYNPEIIVPPSVAHLTLELRQTETRLAYSNPQSLTHLILNGEYNSPVYNLPPNLTHLVFGRMFNKPIDSLPRSIVYLSFGYAFNRSVDNLPPGLTHLYFGDTFDCPVSSLPLTLTTLSFGKFFNQPVDNLPHSLTHLTLGSSFDHPLHFLPPTISHLTFHVHFFCVAEYFPFYFPTNLIELNLAYAKGTNYINLWQRKIHVIQNVEAY